MSQVLLFADQVAKINDAVNGVVWGVPALILLIGTGILMTVLTGFFQFTRFGHMWKETIGKLFKKGGKGIFKSDDKNSISQFQALCTALSATIGTGNIAGIAFAITSGGTGSIFWMWVAAIFGMMTNYSENVLGIFYRKKNKDGEWCGGAMYYLENGLGSKKGCKVIGKVLAILFSCFAILASFGIGNMGQVVSIKESVLNVFAFTPNKTVNGLIIGGVVMLVVALVIIGGLNRIAKANEKIVPFMAIFYIIGAAIIIIMNAKQVGPAFASIFRNAFSFKAAAGGVGGYVIKQAITWGFKRGVFSNEAGLGSSVMVHSASNVKEPVTQGLWGIFEVFMDTIIVCTMTALVVLTTGIVDLETGASISGNTKLGLATEAFTQSFGVVGGIFIAVAVTLFAFSTVLGWSYYGSKAWEYLFGTKSILIYRIVFLVVIVIGSTFSADLAIDLSDTFNGLMAIPNLIGVITLSGTVLAITKNYSARKLGKNPDKSLKPMLSAYADIQAMQEKNLDEE
ncbi:MAG: sodium:alanine symporter family protein [Lachnospiraceae bacterium]|nr:sodium:alanine symporter family protein [Lachnospiraceae bacterium]